MSKRIEDNIKKQKVKRFIFVPVMILVATVVILASLVIFKPKALKEIPEPRLPVVSLHQIEKQTVTIPVYSRGTIKPGTEIPLVSEVQGRIENVSSNFKDGAFFKEGEVLLKIDATNYKLDLAKAKSQVSKAKLNLTRVKADVKANRIAQSSVGKARLEEAQAQFEAAEADYTRAKLLLERTAIKAPFSGRVREALVDVSQYISPGTQIGTIFATNKAEIKLPLSDAQLELIKLPTQFNGADIDQEPRIILRGEYAGHEYFWYGKIVRSEGGINQRNRLLHVIAEIDQPFGKDEDQPNRPPLTIGKFVEVEIEGSSFEDITVIPREMLRNSDQVWTLTEDNRIAIKTVDVMHRGKEKVYIQEGLDQGDWVVTTQLDVVVDGMKVQLADNQKIERLPSLELDVEEDQKNINTPEELLPPLGEEGQLINQEKQTANTNESNTGNKNQEETGGESSLLLPQSAAGNQNKPTKTILPEAQSENKQALIKLSGEIPQKAKVQKPESKNNPANKISLKESKTPVTLLERE